MKIAVITPYHKESLATLLRCHLSVRQQTTECTHFLVSDGFARQEADNWDCIHIKLANAHKDNGNTPRSIGGISAISQGFEAICFLDADNWYRKDHAEEVIRLKSTQGNIDVAALGRQIVLPDGTPVYGDQEDENRSHVDTSCFAFFEEAFSLVPLWGMMQPFLGPICDRIMLAAIRQKNLRIEWSNKKTCFFTSNYKIHYLLAGKNPPPHTNDYDIRAIKNQFISDKRRFLSRTGLNLSIE